MWLVKKCINLLRLQQKFPGRERKQFPDVLCAERNVMNYLKSWNPKLQEDWYGNLYLINPWTPLLNAHMDTVQQPDDAALAPQIYLDDQWKIHWDNIIIWWDDKCWIAIAMEMYERYPNNVSLLFTRQEETGCNWAEYFCRNTPELVKQCTYCLTLDRRWNSDIISNQNWYCSEEFQEALVSITKAWGFKYKPERGLSSDANHIRKLINAVNLSVWYYNPHSKQEYIVADDLKEAFLYVEYIVNNLNWEWPIYVEPPIVYEPYKYKPTYPANYGYWKDSWFYNEEPKKKTLTPVKGSVSLTTPKWKDKRTDDQKYTASFFLIWKDWTLTVRKDIFMYDMDYGSLIEIPAGIYNVDTRDDEEEEPAPKKKKSWRTKVK